MTNVWWALKNIKSLKKWTFPWMWSMVYCKSLLVTVCSDYWEPDLWCQGYNTCGFKDGFKDALSSGHGFSLEDCWCGLAGSYLIDCSPLKNVNMKSWKFCLAQIPCVWQVSPLVPLLGIEAATKRIPHGKTSAWVAEESISLEASLRG